jgi:formylmethanofuran dehydrogenase subunit E
MEENRQIEELKKQKSCAKCGNIITNHKEKMEIGDKLICKACYMTHNPFELKKWINEK